MPLSVFFGNMLAPIIFFYYPFDIIRNFYYFEFRDFAVRFLVQFPYYLNK